MTSFSITSHARLLHWSPGWKNLTTCHMETGPSGVEIRWSTVQVPWTWEQREAPAFLMKQMFTTLILKKMKNPERPWIPKPHVWISVQDAEYLSVGELAGPLSRTVTALLILFYFIFFWAPYPLNTQTEPTTWCLFNFWCGINPLEG